MEARELIWAIGIYLEHYTSVSSRICWESEPKLFNGRAVSTRQLRSCGIRIVLPTPARLGSMDDNRLGQPAVIRTSIRATKL